MSEPYGSYPPDEPVIGAGYPPTTPPSSGSATATEYIGEDRGWQPTAPADQPYADHDAAYGDEWDEYGDDEYYYDDYPEESPARQPLFYVFIGAAALIGGVLIFFLFSLFTGGDDSQNSVETAFRVQIDSPAAGDRVPIGEEKEVKVQARSTEQITKFELFVANKSVAEAQPAAPIDDVYSATLKYKLDRTGEFEVFVRVTSASGATDDSPKIKIVAIQPVGDKPVSIQGTVLATTTLRVAPNDQAQAIKTLNAGQKVKILGKTRDTTWLLVEVDGENWVKRDAIDPEDSLALVPVREPTPTPAPVQPTSTVAPTTPPTVNTAVPDLVPTNAALIDGGSTLRVTISNLASTAYNGALVVAVSKVSVASPQLAVNAQIPANGSMTVDFELTSPITTPGSSATVSIDPANAVKEANEDNNSATFVLTPPAEAPNIVLHAPTVGASTIDVTVQNQGGQMNSAEVWVTVTLNGATNASPHQTLALAKGQSASFSVSRPAGSGTATVAVLVGGTAVASTQVTLD